MILTCYSCPKQICFCGSNRNLFARLFGWAMKGGRYYCTSCGEDAK